MGFFGNIVSSLVNSNPLGQLINTGASLVTNALNRHQQKETNKANAYQNELNRDFTAEQSELDRQFNSAEAQKSRQFNSFEAQKSRDFNSAEALKQREFEQNMWNLQNEYNSPSNQINLLRQAGLNPNLYGGDASAGSVGSGASASSSPASGSPASHGSLGAPSSIPMQPFVHGNPLLESAQIRLANAQAGKLETDTDSEKTRQKYLDAIYQGELDLGNVNIHLGLSSQRLNELQADKVLYECRVLNKQVGLFDASMQEARSHAKLLDAQEVSQAFENQHAIELLSKKLAQIDSEIRKNNSNVVMFNSQANSFNELAKVYLQQAKNAVIEGGSLALQFQFDEETKKNRVELVRIAKEQADFDLNFDKNNREMTTMLKLGGDLFGALGSTMTSAVISYGLLKGVGPAKSGTKFFGGTRTPIIGTGNSLYP